MFGNRAVKMTFIKDKETPTETAGDRNIFEGPEVAYAYAAVAKDFVTHTALVVGGVWIVCKIVGRFCK
jgi:hypothetical protein